MCESTQIGLSARQLTTDKDEAWQIRDRGEPVCVGVAVRGSLALWVADEVVHLSAGTRFRVGKYQMLFQH